MTHAQYKIVQSPGLYSYTCTNRDVFSLVRFKLPYQLTHRTCGRTTHIKLRFLYHHRSAVLIPARSRKHLRRELSEEISLTRPRRWRMLQTTSDKVPRMPQRVTARP
jgi:hypothetical protein